jgi:hypothetical protein
MISAPRGIKPDEIRLFHNLSGFKSSSSKWLPVEIRFFFLKSTSFTSPTFPIQPNFSQNQPAAITLNTSSTRTLCNNLSLTYHILEASACMHCCGQWRMHGLMQLLATQIVV